MLIKLNLRLLQNIKGTTMLRIKTNHFKKHKKMYHHLMRNSLIGLMLITLALLIGMSGYHYFENLSWIDSFLNASMILSGMGPAATLVTSGGKIFAGFYALFSGLAFIAIIVIMLSPIIHTFFRKIHLESKEDEKES